MARRQEREEAEEAVETDERQEAKYRKTLSFWSLDRERTQSSWCCMSIAHSPIRGVAVVDRADRVRLLETFDCDTSTARILVENVLFASVDVLDEREKISGVGATTVGADEQEGVPGLYLGQLASQGRLATFGFVTSVGLRCLICLETDGFGNKMNDRNIVNMLRELSRLYVEETACNPFSTYDDEKKPAAPMPSISIQALKRICE